MTDRRVEIKNLNQYLEEHGLTASNSSVEKLFKLFNPDKEFKDPNRELSQQ